ncbi:hypothetical protein E3N88_40176 [Mikania micrantha]|uniref:Protein FAR1-RELATED SEQUENCE n=1 Tax=Mikania micrantha TaxID=192012 RepID=A0A5N6LLY7_9ASTR|nr:hypothetical protein E3N88_40176 [Mikania micrantha]
MCCLMKTTSRCESSNLMFKVTSGSTNTLVQFLMCFDMAIDNQRLHQIKSIPDRYISNRWRKGTLPSRVYSLSQRLSVDNTEVSVLRNEVIDCVNARVDQLAFNVDGLSSFTQKIKELKKELVD